MTDSNPSLPSIGANREILIATNPDGIFKQDVLVNNDLIYLNLVAKDFCDPSF
jgi:hypothetical protein